MRQIGFTVPEDDLEEVLDGLIHLLPRGARIGQALDGAVAVVAVGAEGTLPGRAALEAAAGRELAAWVEADAPADWQHRRPGEGVLIAGRVLLRGPDDDPPPDGVLDVIVSWAGAGFGSGSHPTTRMAAELLLDVEVQDGLVDVGCGLGTLAILAAALGFHPVSGIDRDPAVIEAARDNAARNGAEIGFHVLDVGTAGIPYRPTIVANAPPEVHARIAARLPADVRTVVASGFMVGEMPHVADAYGVAGLVPAQERRDADDLWVALLLERPDA